MPAETVAEALGGRRLAVVRVAGGLTLTVRAPTLEEACEKGERLSGRAALGASWAPCRHEMTIWARGEPVGVCARCGAKVPRGHEPADTDTAFHQPDPPEAA